MKQVLISAVVAAVVAVVVIQSGSLGGDGVNQSTPIVLSYTPEVLNDAIVDGTRYTGEYSQLLVDAENSICYLTKVQFKAMQEQEDSNICSVEVDEFTGFWEVNSTIEEGGTSEARCNARCLVWE